MTWHGNGTLHRKRMSMLVVLFHLARIGIPSQTCFLRLLLAMKMTAFYSLGIVCELGSWVCLFGLEGFKGNE